MKLQDVIVIGSGGGGAVIAKELGEKGLKVLVLEAGPWYGNKQWPDPNTESNSESSSSLSDLDIDLYKQLVDKQEMNMNDLVTGRYRFGPADRSKAQWFRNIKQKAMIWQCAGVGGTTQVYTANCPRAYPQSVDGKWPFSYKELIPYYEKVEETLPVNFAPVTAKEELFYFGAKKLGLHLNPALDIYTPGYRPQPNAILPPNEAIINPNITDVELSWMEGCTLSGHCINGCAHGPSIEKMAKRSTNVSYIPLALRTGNVSIRPNAFAVKILTEKEGTEFRAIGVRIRDTWTGQEEELTASVVVLACGSIETPRLWLNSSLPENEFVGKGLVTHYMDWITGIFEKKDLLSVIGATQIRPYVGNTCGARLDYPGLGALQTAGMSPGLTASFYGLSTDGYAVRKARSNHRPWDMEGRPVGQTLHYLMDNYARSLSILVTTDDEVDDRNGVALDPRISDENGFVPVIRYRATKKSAERRRKLAVLAADLLRKAGAKQILRSNWPEGMMIHMESTMRIGSVVDENCEAYQVKRLYIADNSVHANGLGGANPTLTTQALAARTAEKVIETYFS
ncbi:GMC family oxidoreductase N-terminal domain-containing protein [Niallia sp. MER 6]|uniref:GMC family oxidoreductase N-terminal domain-containing protein n=1 Tax=Niallia sp. MER 6 TaxID=2939567 RepID=UPI0020415CAC|nr:GMC family oxidoreductase N-terminal domain-containing protein [Niallia sp. MER 6]MCM3033359.1 GMC family oxidoreductase N-terminal domain-containing protein [Niallia sp. MER 6]